MGKAQSKRSVDITTEIPKNVDEGTIGKMGKIEDVDELNQAETKLNGDKKAYANDLAGDILATVSYIIHIICVDRLNWYALETNCQYIEDVLET